MFWIVLVAVLMAGCAGTTLFLAAHAYAYSKFFQSRRWFVLAVANAAVMFAAMFLLTHKVS